MEEGRGIAVFAGIRMLVSNSRSRLSWHGWQSRRLSRTGMCGSLGGMAGVADMKEHSMWRAGTKRPTPVKCGHWLERVRRRHENGRHDIVPPRRTYAATVLRHFICRATKPHPHPPPPEKMSPTPADSMRSGCACPPLSRPAPRPWRESLRLPLRQPARPRWSQQLAQLRQPALRAFPARLPPLPRPAP